MRKYENPKKTSENRLKTRSWYLPEGAAKMIPLNGEWRFAFFENGDAAVIPETWGTIEVPSCWQLKGYEHPNYSNINYPYPCDPPYVPDINPMGIYERSFVLEDGSLDTYLVLEGVASMAEVYLNNQYVGFTQGSHLFAEFDISEFVSSGTNTVRVCVRKWCCGSYLEDQDSFRFNGIFRDIYVLSRPHGHIFDLDITTEGNRLLCVSDAPFTAELYDGEELLDTQSGDRFLEFTVAEPKLWNAEEPNLYTLKLFAAGEEITRKVGFRTVGISPEKELLINGAPVKLKGVNHHDTDPEKGWTMWGEDILRDLRLMKALNINTIRTSHYPPSPVFLDYCDELGFYVILENDMETHGYVRRFGNVSYGYDTSVGEWPCNTELWEDECMDRMRRTYGRDKNHASVIMWSTGNESGYGINQKKMIAWLKENDPVRLCHCEDGSRENDFETPDVYSRMYPKIEDMVKWAEDDAIPQPVFLCEYAHAMGNGPGGIWDYWDAVLAHKKLIGGCIWEWADHVVLDNGVQKYGGDFAGELTHDGNFCCDGMVFANRTLKPGSLEIKNTYAPFRMKWEDGKLVLQNLFDFTSFDGYSFEYDITVDGESAEKRIIKVNTKPHEFSSVPLTVTLPEECRYGVYITVRMLDENGREIAFQQQEIPLTTVKEPDGAPLTLTQTEFTVIAEGEGFRYVLSKQTGFLTSMVKNGEEKLAAPMKLSYFRAPTDNDRNVKAYWDRSTIWQGENYDCVFGKVYQYEVAENRVVFAGSAAGVSRHPFFRYHLGYEFFADGSIKVRLVGNIRENAYWLPRLGFECKLPYGADHFRYFGNGPTESYSDLCRHGTVGWYESTADGEYVPYVRPQEHGNHVACKVLEVENSIRVEAQDSMEISVLHHSIEQLTAAQHTDELKPSDGTHVRIDYKVSGIGSNSCGPALDEQYRLAEKKIEFTVRLSV